VYRGNNNAARVTGATSLLISLRKHGPTCFCFSAAKWVILGFASTLDPANSRAGLLR